MDDKACFFVAYLVDSSLNHATIKGYLSAVRRLQVVAGLGDPFWFLATVGVCFEGG